MGQALLGLGQLLAELDRQIAALDGQILTWHKASRRSRDLATIPGFGPILSSDDPLERDECAGAAPRAVRRRTRPCRLDRAAWIGPPGSGRLDRAGAQEASSGDTPRLGRISKQGDVYLRRLLVNRAHSVLNSKRAKRDPWIQRLLATKPRLVVAVALANKMARIAWAVMLRQTGFRPVPATA